MPRSFTIEFDEAEAATVWRMAELTGVPAAVIVRRLHRPNPGFRHAVDMATSDGDVYEWSEARMVLMTPEQGESTFISAAWR